MHTRKIGGLLCILALIASIVSVTVYNYIPGLLFIFSMFIVTLYITYLGDERIQPHITINDWILGKFPAVSEMTRSEARRRVDTLRYRYEDGPFKIRFVFNRRFDEETIEEYKSQLETIANPDNDSNTSSES